jgi:hypothetical protein
MGKGPMKWKGWTVGWAGLTMEWRDSLTISLRRCSAAGIYFSLEIESSESQPKEIDWIHLVKFIFFTATAGIYFSGFGL